MSLCVVCILMPVFLIGVEGNHCNNATDLSYMTERLVGYVLGPNEAGISDRYLTEGWYRMMGHTLSRSPTKKCGSVVNWYMKGQLPAVGTAGTVIVCPNDGSPCPGLFSKIIDVETCRNGDYIFMLKKTDSTLEAYCIEPLPGTKSPNSAPGISYIGRPIIVTDISTAETEEKLEHFCDFIVKPEHKSFYYTVEWSLSDGRSLAKQLHIGTATKDDEKTFNETTKLTEDHLNFNGIVKLGYTIVCSVKAKQGKTGIYSHVQKSEPKFCGIQILTSPVLRIKDTEKVDIKLNLTVPFGCTAELRKRNNGESCTVDLTLFIPDSSHLNSRCEIFNLATQPDSGSRCGTRFKHDDVGTEHIISVTNQMAGQASSGVQQQFDLLLRTNVYHHHSMINQYSLEPVKVISSVNSNFLSDRKCYAHSDPHMMTFDGKTYENQALGTFCMYRNVKFNTEVQIRTGKCPNYVNSTDKPYCCEAVAIRAGRDVYVIDIKNLDINFKMCEDRVLHDAVRRENGETFRIFLPTGTEIQITKGTVYGQIRADFKHFLEVTIHPGLDDFNNTEGLCGTFDHNDSNDLNRQCYIPGKANLCWRKDHAQFLDLFDPAQRKSLTKFSEKLKLCTCDCQTCDSHVEIKSSFSCSANRTKPCSIKSLPAMTNMMCNTRRSKRDIHTGSETYPDVEHSGFLANYVVKYNAMSEQHRFRRSLFDENGAKNACRTAMNTTIVQMCSSVSGLDVESYINNCALDAMASNSMEWTQIHIEAIKKNCIKYVEFNQPIPQDILEKIIVPTDDDNKTFGNDTSAETTTLLPSTALSKQGFVFTPELLTKIKSVSCINDCNGNGECVKGVCVCDSGYFNDDCSVDINIAPTMFGIPDRGKCDLTKRECKMTAVKGGTFVDTKSLYCRLRPFKVENDGQLSTADPVTVRATFDSFLQVFCPFPKNGRMRRSITESPDDTVASGYRVAVSNNGVRETGFSADDSIIIYDSTCVDCQKQNGSISCSVLPGYCMNNGRCYNKGDQIGCYNCHGDAPDKYYWTPGKDCAHKISDSSNNLWIIGATIGTVVTAVFILLAFFICMKQKQKLRKKMGSTITPMGSLNPIVVTPKGAVQYHTVNTVTHVCFPDKNDAY